LGQSSRLRDVRGMSGLPQTADISGPSRHFAFVPIADIASGPHQLFGWDMRVGQAYGELNAT
jgi:hypothetical protein